MPAALGLVELDRRAAGAVASAHRDVAAAADGREPQRSRRRQRRIVLGTDRKSLPVTPFVPGSTRRGCSRPRCPECGSPRRGVAASSWGCHRRGDRADRGDSAHRSTPEHVGHQSAVRDSGHVHAVRIDVVLHLQDVDQPHKEPAVPAPDAAISAHKRRAIHNRPPPVALVLLLVTKAEPLPMLVDAACRRSPTRSAPASPAAAKRPSSINPARANAGSDASGNCSPVCAIATASRACHALNSRFSPLGANLEGLAYGTLGYVDEVDVPAVLVSLHLPQDQTDLVTERRSWSTGPRTALSAASTSSTRCPASEGRGSSSCASLVVGAFVFHIATNRSWVSGGCCRRWRHFRGPLVAQTARNLPTQPCGLACSMRPETRMVERVCARLSPRVAAVGQRWGTRGRRFKSDRPDRRKALHP
jgi:hypothetical protein